MDLNKDKKYLLKISDPNEKRVANLLLDMGLTFVGSNIEVLNAERRSIGEIDLLFQFEDTLFLIEVSVAKSNKNQKKLFFFHKWMDSQNVNIMRKQCGLAGQKVIRIYFDLGSKRSDIGSVEVERMTTPEHRNVVCYQDDFDYFSSQMNIIGKWARNDFLDFVRYVAREKTLTIDAIQYYIDDLPVFCLVGRVDDLLRACYVARRRTDDLGYQRALQKNRIASISKNIVTKTGLAFPNSILIYTPKIIDEIKKPEDCPAIVKIKFPINYSQCRIIDGQHRLLGFAMNSEEIQKSYYLPVIALQNISKEQEVKTFIDINAKQQRMDSNLILLLKADFKWDEGSRGYIEKIAVRVSERLNQTILSNRIYFGHSEQSKKNKITLTALVTGMRDNDLIDGTVDRSYRNLVKFFEIAMQSLPRNPFAENSYFGLNKGISIFFRLLRLLRRNKLSQTISISDEDFFNDLARVLDSQLIANLEDYYGDGGSKAAAAQVINILQKKYPTKYKNMKSKLTQLPRNKKNIRSQHNL